MSNTSTGSGVEVEIASQGRYYKSGSSKAVIKRITGEQEAMLADANAQTFPTIADNVLKSVILANPAESYDKLLIGDKYHLLFLLRMVSYPNDRGYAYGCSVDCPKCKHMNEVEFDFRKKLSIKHPHEKAVEPIELTLPVSNTAVKLRLMRVFDEHEMLSFVREQRRKRELPGDPAYFFTMARGLLEINGEEPDFDVAVEFIRQAEAGDLLEIKDAVEAHDAGVDFEVDFACEQCGTPWYQRMPMSADFFRPGVAKRRRGSRPKI